MALKCYTMMFPGHWPSQGRWTFLVGRMMLLEADGDTSRGTSLGMQACFISSCSPGMAQGVNIFNGSILGLMGCS